jgi:concanavalin A-like lectin/glucanase superfamily protein
MTTKSWAARSSTFLVVLAGLAAQSRAATVGYWRFEEGVANVVAGGLVLDSSPAGNHGIPFGVPTYRSDVPVAVIPQTGAANNLSLELTSMEDFVSFASAFPLNNPGDMTFEFWLKWQNIQNGSVILGTGDASQDVNRFQLQANLDFTLGLDYVSENGDLHVLAGSGLPQNGVPFSPGKWGHVAIVRQGNTYRLYVNAVLQSTVTDTFPDLPTSLGWSLGGRAGFPFIGLVDEVRASDVALSPDQFLLSPPPVLTVKIDVKPRRCHDANNFVEPKSMGYIPVAILSSSTFDATTVNPATVRFGVTGTEAAGIHPVLMDADGDGTKDLVLYFRTSDTGIVCGTTQVFLTGSTKGGQLIRGSDQVKTIGCGNDHDRDHDRDGDGRDRDRDDREGRSGSRR